MTTSAFKISHDRLIQLAPHGNNHYLIYQIDDNHWLNADEEGSREEDEQDNAEELQFIAGDQKNFIAHDEEPPNEDGEPARIMVGSITLNTDDDTFVFEGDQTISLSDQMKIKNHILEME